MAKKNILSFSNDQYTNPTYKIITELEPTSVAAEAYRRVKIALDYSAVDKKIQVIQFCSAMQGEGKTVSLLNIAATYAEDDKKVIIIDMDLRRPKLHRAFHVENKNGLTDYLANVISKEEIIQHSKSGIDFIVRGTKVPNPSVMIGSEAINQLFTQLRKEYDYILVDCPPILAVADAVIISKLCDGCLFIVSNRVTTKGAAKEAVTTLRKNNVNLIGCVFVGVTKHDKNYGYYSYYNYGYFKDGSATTEHEHKEGK